MAPKIVVEPVVLEDFDEMATFREEAGGDLHAPILDATWPVNESNGFATRNAWSLKQQKWQFQNDPTAVFIKAVDANTKEIMSLARWHYYTDGFPLENTQWEIDVFSEPGKEDWPEGMAGSIHSGSLRYFCDVRPKWNKPGPGWVLTTLITRKDYRKRGAGGLLLDWGIEKAAARGVPAYLEAMPGGLSLYKKHGFRHQEDLVADGKSLGLEHDIVLAAMIKEP